MLLRCSVCKGQFDVEPDMKKPTVFCSHCGAQLQTIKPGRRRARNNTQAVGALSGEQLPGLQEEPAPPEPTLGGFVEEFEAPPMEQAPAPIQPVASSASYDSFPTGGNMAAPQYSSNQYVSNQYSSGPAGGMRKPVRRKKDNGMLIAMILVGVFVVGVGVTVTVIALMPEEEKKVEVRERPVGDAGELFKDVKAK